MRSWQKWFIRQGTPLLTQELGSRGELQSKVMEDGDTTTHALQGECKTYRGCQSSGVTDSDSERQHEINMAVQTVQGKGHTDCREGGTETHTLAQTHICMFPSRTQHKVCAAGQGCTPAGRTPHTQSQPHLCTHRNPRCTHSCIKSHFYVFTYLLAIAHPPTHPG